MRLSGTPWDMRCLCLPAELLRRGPLQVLARPAEPSNAIATIAKTCGRCRHQAFPCIARMLL